MRDVLPPEETSGWREERKKEREKKGEKAKKIKGFLFS